MNVNPNRLRGLLLALVSSLALISTGTAAAAVASGAGADVEALVEAIDRQQAITWHWQRVMGKRRTQPTSLERRLATHGELVELRDLWRRRADRARAKGKRPPHRAAWRCIHRYEGSWTDPNAPYWGGLQMSIEFQRAFGRYLLRRKGTADRWTRAEQMWTAEKALRAGLGFHPWPNTARRCGLL
jgi:hypothetical protein